MVFDCGVCSVLIIIDVSLFNCKHIIHIQNTLRHMLQEQMCNKHYLNLIASVPAYSYYIRQVNGVKLVDIMFSLLCFCLSVCPCALSPIGLNGQNDVLFARNIFDSFVKS